MAKPNPFLRRSRAEAAHGDGGEIWFAEYRRALQTVDCTLLEFALREEDGWQLTDAILDVLTPELDCLFLCTPNNPTGLRRHARCLTRLPPAAGTPASRLFLMKRLSISFLTSRDLSPFYSIIRISGCSAHSPNSTPFPACVWAIWLTAMNGRWPACAKTNAVVDQRVCRSGRGNSAQG